jgi:hypothetical protein
MAGRSRTRARGPRFRLFLPRPPGSVAVGYVRPHSRFSAAPHIPTVTRETPRSHHCGLAERPGGRGAALMTAQPRDDARIDEGGRCSPRGRDHPPSGMSSSCRRSPLRSPRRHAPASVDRDRLPTSRPRSRSSTRGHRLRGGLASVRFGPSGRAVASSSPSVPPMRCPGSGSGAPVGSRPRSLALARPVAAVAASHIRPRWRSCLRRHGLLLASRVPRRGHLHIYKGTRGPEPCRPGRGILLGSFRGPQLRALLLALNGPRFIPQHASPPPGLRHWHGG